MLTRRDRAALTLALECLRDNDRGYATMVCVRQAMEIMEHGSYPLHRDLGRYVAVGYKAAHGGGGVSPRILRARLALALRVLLRADIDDCYLSEWICMDCGSGNHSQNFNAPLGCCICHDCGGESIVERPHHRITPLWEMAPSSGRGR